MRHVAASEDSTAMEKYSRAYYRCTVYTNFAVVYHRSTLCCKFHATNYRWTKQQEYSAIAEVAEQCCTGWSFAFEWGTCLYRILFQ